ncbi:ATPase, partial [Streptomonospora algeriensis]
MPRDERSRTSEPPHRASILTRVRTAYYGYPLRTRLFAGLGVVTVLAVAARLLSLPVLTTVTAAAAALLVFAALMRSSDAVATALISIAWLVLAYALFLIPVSVADSGALLLLPLLPLLVSLAATRITAFPVWHTTLLALLVALITGLGTALAGMLAESTPGALGVLCAFGGAGLALLWRVLAAYRLRRTMSDLGAPPPAHGDGIRG